MNLFNISCYIVYNVDNRYAVGAYSTREEAEAHVNHPLVKNKLEIYCFPFRGALLGMVEDKIAEYKEGVCNQ